VCYSTLVDCFVLEHFVQETESLGWGSASLWIGNSSRDMFLVWMSHQRGALLFSKEFSLNVMEMDEEYFFFISPRQSFIPRLLNYCTKKKTNSSTANIFLNMQQ